MRRHHGASLLLGVMALTACDFEVTNPGPVADEFLDDPGAFQPLVNGIGRELNHAMNGIATEVATRTREVMPNDNQIWEGFSQNAYEGIVSDVEANNYNPWAHSQAARWIAEDVIRRFTEVMPDYDSNEIAAKANLWSGFAYRAVGEFFCEFTEEAGPAQPRENAFMTAEARFTTALDIANNAGATAVAQAAQAARASVRINLGDWAGAVDDANQIGTDFRFVLPYQNNQPWRYFNAFVQGLTTEGRAYTIWNTPYESYYLSTGDPRTPWLDTGGTLPTNFDLDVGDDLPNYRQQKYTDLGDDIDLVTGEEMRLIEAEDFLRSGLVDEAMMVLNDLRARVQVAPWPAPTDLNEAWTFFKMERGIELWMEGRRLADRWRWEVNGSPGSLTPEEMGGTHGSPVLTDIPLCLPIPESERDQNPNF